MIGILLPGLVLIVALLKKRYDALAYSLAAWLIVNVVAVVWDLGAEDGEGLPFWLVLMVVALWLGMLGSLMVEPSEGSWWARHRLDQRFSVFFRFVGIALLIACPVGIGIAYLVEGTIGGVIVMGVFAAVCVKVFLVDEILT